MNQEIGRELTAADIDKLAEFAIEQKGDASFEQIAAVAARYELEIVLGSTPQQQKQIPTV